MAFCNVFNPAAHVAGIACGNGYNSKGKYSGIAPDSNIIALKVLDKDGSGNTADVLAGLQWVYDHKDIYNIKVINLSMGTPEGDKDDPLLMAVEKLWDSGIVVVAAAGNSGPDSKTITSPGISKKVITVGASDDSNAVIIWGNTLVNFSGRGPTGECIIKPNILAPGTNIISCLTPDVDRGDLEVKGKDVIEDNYISLNGTSMATPIVTGAIAVLLENNMDLTPDEVKYLIKKSAIDLKYPCNQQGWGLINVENLIILGSNLNCR